MADGNNVTNSKLYDYLGRVDANINSVRLELKGDLNRLESKFDTLEAGRLTRLEERVSRGEVRQAINGTKLAVLVAGVTLTISAITTIILDRIIK